MQKTESKRKIYVISVLLFVLLFAGLEFIKINLYRAEIKNLKAKYVISPMEIDKVKIIAHRGICDNEPENSINAIEASINYKVDYAEIDVQETKDGVVVLMHDKNLKRETGLNKDVNQVTFKEIEKLTLAAPFSYKSKYERIPTLEQVIEETKGRLNLIIEIKPYGNTKELTNKVVDIIEKNDFVNQCKIHSLSYNILLQVNKINNNIETGFIVTRPLKTLPQLGINFYSINQRLITAGLVQRIHKSNKTVYAWTADNDADMNNSIRAKVDGIITDTPRLLINRKKANIHKL